jgi:hypothetical protein
MGTGLAGAAQQHADRRALPRVVRGQEPRLVLGAAGVPATGSGLEPLRVVVDGAAKGLRIPEAHAPSVRLESIRVEQPFA